MTRLEDGTRGAFLRALFGRSGVRRGVGGVDFDDYREYLFGDDWRAVDQNLWARSEKAFVKRFREDVAPTVYCCVDRSRSMRVGSKFERAVAAAVAAAYSSAAEGASVGFGAFDAGISAFAPPVRGKERAAVEAASFFRRLEPDGASVDWARFVADFLKRRADSGRFEPTCVVLISDFFDGAAPISGDSFSNADSFGGFGDKSFNPESATALERLLAAGVALFLVRIADVGELEPDAAGPVELEDAESGEIVRTTLDAGAAARCRTRVAEYWAALKAFAARREIRTVDSTTDEPFDVLFARAVRDAATRGDV